MGGGLVLLATNTTIRRDQRNQPTTPHAAEFPHYPGSRVCVCGGVPPLVFDFQLIEEIELIRDQILDIWVDSL